MTQAAEKKDVQKLQRIIVDALEDVKALDIAVYNTEHLSSLFERVILASGTSNRQTKALAANVRDEVRKSGHTKPRIEGEENGEWIIVDCGAAVVHIMQPNIREYYHLEEIWGDKPVRLKFGAPKPVFAKAQEEAVEKKKALKKAAPAAKTTKSSASKAKSTRSSKSSSRSLPTPVDPKTGLTTPVNNSRRAIDKRPYLAELPEKEVKAKRASARTKSSGAATSSTQPKSSSKAPRSLTPSRAKPLAKKPAQKKSAPKGKPKAA